jgi:hypothetical protein
MTTSDKPFQSGNERATNERVQRALTTMAERRRDFQEARQLGAVDDSLHLLFQSSIVEVHDALRPFKGSVSRQWREAARWKKGLKALPKAVAARPQRRVKTVGFGRETVETEYQPQLLREDHLLEMSYELDEIAREIGFETEPGDEEQDQDGGVI